MSPEPVSSRPASDRAGSGPPTSSLVGSESVRPVSAIPIATALASVGSGPDGPVTLGTGSHRIHEESPDTGQGRSGPAESPILAQAEMSADLLAGMVLCLLAISGAAFGYYLTVSVVMVLLLFNNTFFACFNSRTVKRWFTKKGGRLKPDKTAKEGEDPFKVSGREILANMDKNTKQALWQAKRGVRKTVSLLGAVSYFVVASLALILVSRDSCTCAGQFDNLREGDINYTRKLCSCYRNSGCSSSGAVYRSRSGDCDRIRSGDSVGLGGGARPGGARPGKGHWDLLRSGGGDGFEILGSGSGDRLGLVRGEGLRPVGGDGLRGGGGNGLGPGSGGRLRLGGSDRLGDGQIGYGSDHLGCDGSDRTGCTGSNQLGLGSDNQIEGDGLTWAGDGTKDIEVD